MKAFNDNMLKTSMKVDRSKSCTLKTSAENKN